MKNNIFRLKAVVLCCITVASSASQASETLYFFNQQSRIGCGTITSVRNVNQAPLYDRAYEMRFVKRGGDSDIAMISSAFGVVGTAAALVAKSIITDTVADNISIDTVVAPADGVWKHVKAVSVTMDDGNIINVPLTEERNYKAGARVEIYVIKDRNSIQIGTQRPIPATDTKLYQYVCRRTADEALAVAFLKEKSDLVQEDKIVE